MADIEARIAELILSAQSSTESVVALPLVENIIAQLGSPEDISGEEQAEQPKESRIPRRLYRDLENSKLGGVCAGLAKYLNMDVTVIRLIMVLLTLLGALEVLTPANMFLYQLVWMIPAFLFTEWTRSV